MREVLSGVLEITKEVNHVIKYTCEKYGFD